MTHPSESPLDLSDSQKWTLKFSKHYSTPSGNSVIIDPIPPEYLNTTFNSSVLAVQAVSLTNHVRYVGKIQQFAQIGIIEGGQLSYLSSRALYMGTRTIQFYHNIEPPYFLKFIPSRALTNLSLLIYEYL